MYKFSYVPSDGSFNRKTLNVLWMLFFAILVCQAALLPLAQSTLPRFSLHNYVMQNFVQIDISLLAINLLLEFILRKFKKLAEIAVIAGTHLYTYTIVLGMISEPYIAAILTVLPVIVAVFYLKTTYIIVAISINLIGNIIIVIWDGTYNYYDMSALTAVIGVSLSIALIGRTMERRGYQLLKTLEKSMESEQEYMIQNIVMDRMSKLDLLTELYNHKTFHEYFDRLIDHHGQLSFALHLAVMDIDNFKKVNDTYGHAVGDIALKMVAEQIKKHTGPDDFAARYGGEEFVTLLTTIDADEALATLEKLREAIASTPIPEMDGMCVTVSIGLHTYQAGDTKTTSFQRADQALYEAKRTGKNKIVVR